MILGSNQGSLKHRPHWSNKKRAQNSAKQSMCTRFCVLSSAAGTSQELLLACARLSFTHVDHTVAPGMRTTNLCLVMPRFANVLTCSVPFCATLLQQCERSFTHRLHTVAPTNDKCSPIFVGCQRKQRSIACDQKCLMLFLNP